MNSIVIGGKEFVNTRNGDLSFYHRHADKNIIYSIYLYEEKQNKVLAAKNFGEAEITGTKKECIKWLENELNKVYFYEKFKAFVG